MNSIRGVLCVCLRKGIGVLLSCGMCGHLPLSGVVFVLCVSVVLGAPPSRSGVLIGCGICIWSGGRPSAYFLVCIVVLLAGAGFLNASFSWTASSPF